MSRGVEPDAEAPVLRVVVDHARCIGAGTCVVAAPGSFRLGPSHRAEVIEPPGDEPAAIREAASGCPLGAIRVSEGQNAASRSD